MTSNSSVTSSTQIGSASPQNRFFEIIQSRMLVSHSSSRVSPSMLSGSQRICFATCMISSRQSMLMNHSSTSRKTSSSPVRQQCG